MAKLNDVRLYGFPEKKPDIRIDRETGEPVSAMCYIHVVRSHRDDHSGKRFMKHDFPLIISLDKHIIEEMMTWEAFDLVHVKGTLTTRKIDKPSYCEFCTEVDEKGNENATKNDRQGVLAYLTPIYARKESHCKDKKEALSKLISSREISNSVLCFATLMTDPTVFKTNAGTIVTQFKGACNRKWRIVTDREDIRTDWPWIKAYGKEAIEARMKLSKGSEVYVDGALQARTIHRKTKCRKCGKIYGWEDRTLEIVPFALEYVSGFKTDEMLVKEKRMEIDEIKKQILDFKEKDRITEDEKSEDIDRSTVEEEDSNT